jgi:hypothetical protein
MPAVTSASPLVGLATLRGLAATVPLDRVARISATVAHKLPRNLRYRKSMIDPTEIDGEARR